MPRTPDEGLAKLTKLADHHRNGLLTREDFRREAAIALLDVCEYVRQVTLLDVRDKLDELRKD